MAFLMVGVLVHVTTKTSKRSHQIPRTLSARSVLFKATLNHNGLPLPGNVDYLDEANITGYHVDMDFQKVTLPGDPKPFVVPRHVTVTVITDKGKLLMSGEFALKK